MLFTKFSPTRSTLKYKEFLILFKFVIHVLVLRRIDCFKPRSKDSTSTSFCYYEKNQFNSYVLSVFMALWTVSDLLMYCMEYISRALVVHKAIVFTKYVMYWLAIHWPSCSSNIFFYDKLFEIILPLCVVECWLLVYPDE